MGEARKKQTKSFEFKESASIRKSTGQKAKTLLELRQLLADVSERSLYHHIYQYFLKQHVVEYTNDFAEWIGESLEERALAEQLSNVDPYGFSGLSSLRAELLQVIDRYLEQFPEPREALPGNEFYFNETVTLTFPVGIKAQNLAEFFIGIRFVDVTSLYYHFYEARVRQGIDDFSRWLEGTLGEKELAEEIRRIDPFMHTLEGIREHIVNAVERAVQREMEVF